MPKKIGARKEISIKNVNGWNTEHTIFGLLLIEQSSGNCKMIQIFHNLDYHSRLGWEFNFYFKTLKINQMNALLD